MGMMIIKTKKMSAKDVKKKLHEFIDELAEDCGPDMEQMAEELKLHGDDFIDALTGNTGTEFRGEGGNASYKRGRAWHREGGINGSGGTGYRNEGSWEEREELRKKNERELQELDRQMQEMKARMREMY